MLRSRRTIAAASAASSSSSSSLPGSLFWREVEGREQKEKGRWRQRKGLGGDAHPGVCECLGGSGQKRGHLSYGVPCVQGEKRDTPCTPKSQEFLEEV